MAFKRVMIIGSTGMLGLSMSKYLSKFSNLEIVTVSRTTGSYVINLEEKGTIEKVIKDSNAELIINAAALVSMIECENNYNLAYRINTELVKDIAKSCNKLNKKLLHISTDHYYCNDQYMLHDESCEITLINNYAKTKYLGEKEALKNKDSLILRTNITGLRGKSSSPTFFEWVYNSLKEYKNINAFNDFYTSTIDTNSFSNFAFSLVSKDCEGIYNLASSECKSKKEFIELVGNEMQLNFRLNEASVMSIRPKRANSLGLNCEKAENILETKLPNAFEVVKNLVSEKVKYDNEQLKNIDN